MNLDHLEALDLLRVECGREQHVGEEVERGLEALARRLEGETDARASREAADLGGEILDRAREREVRVSIGAARPHGGEEARESGAGGVLGEQAAEECRSRSDHRHAASRRYVQHRPVAERDMQARERATMADRSDEGDAA